MGTNDVRTGNAERANKNIQEIAKLLDLEATIVAHIPPIEIGQQGSDQYEDMQVDRGIYNRTITTAFPNHAKMSALVKEQHNCNTRRGGMKSTSKLRGLKSKVSSLTTAE